MSEFIRPAPDSQFRLKTCVCGGKHMAYEVLERIDFDEYRATCMNCGRRTPWKMCRHYTKDEWREMVRRG